LFSRPLLQLTLITRNKKKKKKKRSVRHGNGKGLILKFAALFPLAAVDFRTMSQERRAAGASEVEKEAEAKLL
jgi:hypothetical protein